LPIVDGSWDISASFAPALIEKGVLSTRRVLVNWWKDGVTDQRLAARKQGPVGGYLVGLSTAAGMAATI
jgi:zinc protease